MRRSLLVVALAGSVAAAATTPAFAASPASTGPVTVPAGSIPGTAPLQLTGATDRGPAPAQTQDFTIALRQRGAAGLASFLADPHHTVLTPKQFNDRYSPHQSTVDAVAGWAHAAGLSVNSVSPNRTLVALSGSRTAVVGLCTWASTATTRRTASPTRPPPRPRCYPPPSPGRSPASPGCPTSGGCA